MKMAFQQASFRSRPALWIPFALLFLIFFALGQRLYWRTPGDHASSPDMSWKSLVTSQLATYNGTLGFEKVLAIGLPERSDKRDAMSLMAAVTGLKLSWVDGVKGATVADSALPNGWDRKGHPESSLGSWRGHIDAIRKIVEDGLSSALIMEDDMDWDTHLKSQMTEFAEGVRFLETGFPTTADDITAPSPYGQNWDMLWVGSCMTTFAANLTAGHAPPNPDLRRYVIRDDATVPPASHLVGANKFSYADWAPASRVVHVPGDLICSFAYALSQSGARKALQYLAVRDVHKPFDNHLSDFCRLRPFGARCAAVAPSLFVHHRPRGRQSKDSDIAGKPAPGAPDKVREKGFTDNILYSTRLNIERLLSGLEPEKQWKD